MNLYRISVIPGVEPTLYNRQTQGFIQAPSKAKAIAQFLKHPECKWTELPLTRVVAESKTDVGSYAWEIEQEMFPALPKSA